MLMTSGTMPLCGHCGRPVVAGLHVSRYGYLYHLECTQPPRASGVLTEQRVREIVREELAKQHNVAQTPFEVLPHDLYHR